MTSKEALLMLKLGAVIRRPHWDEGSLLSLEPDGRIVVRYYDGDIFKDSVDSFLAQKHTDWEVYCPQDNK